MYLIDQSINKAVDFKLKGLTGHITSKNDINIKFNGFLQDKVYSGKLTGAGLNNLIDIDLPPLVLTKSVVSFITSPVHVPVRRLFGKGLPEDGKEACKAMWEASENPGD